jgi:hypothetical protein
LILDLDLISGHLITVLVLSTVLQVCNKHPPSVQNTMYYYYYYYYANHRYNDTKTPYSLYA